MSVPRLSRVSAILLLSSLVLPLGTVDAQIGSIRRGVRMIQEAEKKDTPSGTSFGITADRVDAVLAVMLARREQAVAQQAARNVEREFTEWEQTFVKCVEGAVAAGVMPTTESLEASAKFSEQQAKVLERMSAASSNPRLMQYISDTARVITVEVQLAMFSITKCGKPRYTPAAVIEARIQRSQGKSDDPSSTIDVPADKRAGMSHYQFGMVRERIALWALMQDGVISAEKAGKSGVFTEAESSALKARQADIDKLTPLFKDNTLQWLGWGDISNW